MNIAKQIVDNQITNLITDYSDFFDNNMSLERKKTKAFLMIALSSYLGIDISDSRQYLTDGGSDGGFDAAYIDKSTIENSQIDIFLFQAKYTFDLNKDSNFPENAIEKSIDTIFWVFDPNKHCTLNEESRAVVSEIQSLLHDGFIPNVHFVCMSNGIKWNNNAQNRIDSSFENQSQVTFEFFNHDDIVKRSNSSNKVNGSIQLDGKAIREDFNYKSVIIGKVQVTEISKLMAQSGDSLLDKNIRKFLGSNIVNDAISKTLVDPEKNMNFFFYNNGITIVCDKFSANYLQEKDWNVKIDNIQIINGGQTCKTIFQTLQNHQNIDFTNVDVLVRIYQVDEKESKVVNDITLATNSQNPVDLRDLKSNYDEQKYLETSANELGYSYKRKRDNQINNAPGSKTISSSVCAEAVLTVWRKKPFLAKYHKSELFSTYYAMIFKDLNAAQMVIAVDIFRYCDNMRRKYTFCSGDKEYVAQRRFNNYFMSMLIGQALLNHFTIQCKELTHKNFTDIHNYLSEKIDDLYCKCERSLVKSLKEYLWYLESPLSNIDGRTIAAAFRNADFSDKCLADFQEVQLQSE